MALNINGTTGISGVDGSASTPALQGTDSNTGINFGSDTVNINTGGSTRATVDSSGRFLLGTTTAGHSDLDDLTINSSGNTGITIRSGTSNLGILGFADGTSGNTQYRGVIQYSHSNDSMQFNTADAERMRIDSSGSVGIGTTSPSAHLGVEGDGNECLRLKNTTGIINRIIFQDNASRQAEIIMHTGNLQFSPHSGGSVRFELKENGQGNHNYTTNCNPKEIYNWSNNKTGMSFRSASTERGNIFFFDSGVQFNTSSDYRLKENVTSISDGITRIKQLIPRKFNWIIDESNTPVDGFLAHEVSSIVPEAVNGTKDAVATQEDVDSGRSQKVGDPIHQMIDHSKLVPLLTAALKEAIIKIEVLETKVAALEAG